ncbi:MAG: hypothetical protein HC922_03700 [Leptolyngbyaceae cyanobacterium SM2_3_12]|nr:hypothetical protein [Leptolyngbyaceae cyanobacterium SM2_3_12]
MTQSFEGLRRLPVVAVLCGLVFLIYGLGLTGRLAVICDRAAPNQVQCQVTQPRLFTWLPPSTQLFQLQDVTIASELCDNNPRGGVRYCHRLTLVGTHEQHTLPEVRTPLSATTLLENLRGFIAGEGSPRMAWSTPTTLPNQARTGAIGLLLLVTTWGLWDLRWPPHPASFLEMDGAAEPETGDQNG